MLVIITLTVLILGVTVSNLDGKERGLTDCKSFDIRAAKIIEL